MQRTDPEHEVDLLRRVQEHEPGAADDLLRHWEPRISAIARRTVNWEVGGVSQEDLAQSLRLELWQTAQRLDLSEPALRTMRSVSRRLKFAAIDYLRAATGWRRTRNGRSGRRPLTFEHISDEKWHDVQQALVVPDRNFAEERRAFHGTLNGVPAKHRVMCEQLLIDGCTMKEIGRQWGLSQSRVSQIISRSLTIARENFSTDGAKVA